MRFALFLGVSVLICRSHLRLVSRGSFQFRICFYFFYRLWFSRLVVFRSLSLLLRSDRDLLFPMGFSRGVVNVWLYFHCVW